MPGFFRKLLGLRPKPKVSIPTFKNSEEYFEWRHKTYNEPLPLNVIKHRTEVAERLKRQEEQRQAIMDNARDRLAKKTEAKQASAKK